MEDKKNDDRPRPSGSSSGAFPEQKHLPKARQAYDNEADDTDEISGRMLNMWPGKPPSSTFSAPSTSATIRGPLLASKMNFGDHSERGLPFVPFELIQKFPYMHVADTRYQDEVVSYFNHNLFSGRLWYFFVLLDPRPNNRRPLLLVPSVQFQNFLRFTSTQLNGNLTVPQDEAGEEYFLTFGEEDSPVPRFLGQAGSSSVLKVLEDRLKTLSKDDLSRLPLATIKAYRSKVDRIYDSVKGPLGKRKAEAARFRKTERQKSYSRMIKRVQRYLGLRKQRSTDAFSADPWDVNTPVPYQPMGSVRFVCVDVEAMERNLNNITEIGLAILDTTRTEDVAPGVRGENWFSRIETHHLRVEEYSSEVNHRYVKGCPEAFNFGTSVFVPLKEVSKVLGKIIGDNQSTDKRPVIMVGHDIKQDLNYLKKVGYNVWRLKQFSDEVDTMFMFRRMERNMSGGRLEVICDQLGTSGHDFHNAGNDAVYTLRAMITMAMKRTVEGSDFQIEGETPIE
ncbi:hypothetical protein F5X99DRAFT_385140 [Biscogniauxia marginata]|nr:hypothetical protein F5X99DRAFT_385140 [Biscogniauxia marginata]